MQNRECGEPGDYTHLTSWFVLNHATNASNEFGRTDKVVVHEWANLRWGVFEEYGYPGDAKFPMFYMKTTWGADSQTWIFSSQPSAPVLRLKGRPGMS